MTIVAFFQNSRFSVSPKERKAEKVGLLEMINSQ